MISLASYSDWSPASNSDTMQIAFAYLKSQQQEARMNTPNAFLEQLFDTFDKSSIVDFRNFLSSNPGVSKWLIAADFCLHDKERPNDTFAFTVVPYDDFVDTLKSEINSALPKDLKKTRDIDDNAKAFLSSPRRFHLVFVFKTPPKVFNNGPNSDELTVARESLSISYEQMKNLGRSEENLKRLNLLLQASKSRRFNVELLNDLFMLSYLLCFVTLILARERKSTIIGWFSDRDSMTTWCDGVLWDICNENLLGLASLFSISIPEGPPTIAVPTPGEKGSMWYDEFVRLPDYIAGILAAWDLEENLIPGDKDKYRQLADGVIANATNLAVIRVQYDDIIECARVVFCEAEAPSDNQTGET